MKKILIVILAIFQITKTIAQNTEENSPNKGQDPCARPQIVTNPFASQNTEWYSQRNLFNWMDYVTLHNGGKMRIPYFDNNNLYLNGQNSINYFNNPFFDDDEDYLKHINLFSNTTDLKDRLVLDNDFSNFHRLVDEMDITSVEHGWELLWKFDGFEADGITPVSGVSGSDFKSMNFILYNRYTGMLRWFTAPRVNGTTYTELEPIIVFKGGQVASLFRNYNRLDQALDKTTEVVRIASPAKTSYNLPYFSMADFNISYDPCVCYFDSKLGYGLNAITSANIDLYGRLEGTSQMLSVSDAVYTDRLLSVYKDNRFINTVKNGLLEYKNYGKLVEDFKKLENKTNVFDDIYGASKVLADVAEFGTDMKKPWKYLKTASKFMGFASMPFKTDKSTKSPPMLIQAQMTLTGQLNSSVPLNGFSFDMYTPGSYNTSSDLDSLNLPNHPDRFEYPVYNQALGLYAMLKTPTKEIAKVPQIEEPVNIVYGNTTVGSDVVKLIDSTTRIIRYNPREVFKLNHDLAYTFNPSAQINFDSTTLEAAWIIEVENYRDTAFWLVNSPNLTKSYSYINDNNKHITVFISEFMPIECISQFVAIMDFSLTDRAKRCLYTDYSNWSSDDKLDHYAWSHFNAINRNKPKIVNTFLKKNILYRYNKPDNTGLNDIVHFETRTFNIEGNTINNAIFEAPGFNVFTSTAEITFENKHFTAPEYIYANEKITLKGNITCDPGVEVTIVAGEEIVVEEGAEIGETISLMVGLPSVCNSTRIRPTPIDKSFCENREQYKANSTMAKNDFVPIQNTVLNRSVIYPNPTATGSFMVETYLEQESFITINVYDFAGKKLLNYRSNETLLKGNHKTPFDNTYLEPGIYLVEVETNQGKKTYKLIKN
jgi:hypothetical protein